MRGERGAVTSMVMVQATALVVLTLAAVAGGRVLVAHRQAASAADLGALAAAVAVQHGEDACAAADRLVARAGARLSGCDVSGARVRVTVVRPAGTVAGHPIRVSARAHAGPRLSQRVARNVRWPMRLGLPVW